MSSSHEHAVRAVPGVGVVAVEAFVRWAPGVEPHQVLTDEVVDQQVDGLIDRAVTGAVDRFIESLA